MTNTSIPPAYTEHIGAQLMAALDSYEYWRLKDAA